ncbi:hypothetical protein [Winogradskyella alexanderae]|uniref:Lipoprotein n=1 Tax=Winogradskyella alexanderae TaxID=2877123 RepID=A0ABS7XP58_9FLAO|nr:hypothetical protein [Winogradskyella alexanderae]MCA0131785.1 hypothetical protein [Winogradskyella alexanderae]
MRKLRSIVVIGLLFMLSSCIVKSIRPFYLKEHVKFNEKLIGNWTTGKNSTWQITSFKESWEKDNEGNLILKEEDKEAFESYKEAYIINYTSSEKEALFLAMPFMVDEHLFLDFTPFDFEDSGINGLAAQHLLKTHSAAFVDFQEDGSIKFKWLDESVLKNLIDQKKIKIKHEKTGIDEDFILTASSEELYKFLKKFMASDIEKKWDKDVIKTLIPANAKP